TANESQIKKLSLVALVVQNTAVVIFMRASRLTKGDMYITSTAVVTGELMKLLVCIGIIFKERRFDVQATTQHLKEQIFDNLADTMKLSVPAIMYTLQGNLLYVAISNLDAATYQVTYQLKILTTAIFSVWMLGKHLTNFKWLSLFILMSGVALVQIPTGDTKKEVIVGNQMLGLFAVLAACCSSGFAGVYFEKILKGTSASIWIRNVQLGSFGFIIGMVVVAINDYSAVVQNGFFYGYTPLVWLVITLQAAGGLIIAVVVKYADNILKGFATSVSIILASIISVIFFDFQPTTLFLLGASMVIGAVGMYSRPDPPAAPVLPTEMLLK
ncbi:UDP-N-acetylglucosamine transporter, partial [Sphaeroforma arctica JP610]